MSAQSSARSKRRQSALFNSKSLLHLPQISVDSIATSTPARGNQSRIPAPLPTPRLSTVQPLSTPARTQDDNTTFFAFSPGAEADETALLAVDYRSIGRGGVAADEQSHAELFDDTAILEQRAFAARRSSDGGDQSLGGLGALIFSNLIGGNQAQDALDRLELGKRREGNTSRRGELPSPIRRNASFTLSTGGEPLVDYETDVRFGDDLQAGFEEADETASTDKVFPVKTIQSSFHLGTTSADSQFAPLNPQDSTEPAVGVTIWQEVDDGIPGREQLKSHSPPHRDTFSQQRASSGFSQYLPEPTVQEAVETANSATPNDPVLVDSANKPVQTSAAMSPANMSSPASTYAGPSPCMAEKRLARRIRRGLTASMAVLLSPVAEDRDREKSMSRSRSMLLEAIESQCIRQEPASEGHTSTQGLLNLPNCTEDRSLSEDTRRKSRSAHIFNNGASAHERDTPNSADASKHIFPLPTSTQLPAPIPLASVLANSLSDTSIQRNNSISRDPCASASNLDSLIEVRSVYTAISQQVQLVAGQQRRRVKVAPSVPHIAVKMRNQLGPSQPAREPPSYLKPTLSRSVRQRDPVSLRCSTSSSKARSTMPATSLSKTSVASRVDRTLSQSKSTLSGGKIQRRAADHSLVTNAPRVVAVRPTTSSLSKKGSVDDLFERRQHHSEKESTIEEGNHGHKSPITTHEDPVRDTRSPCEAMQPRASVDVPMGGSGEVLTVPRGFAFGSSRREKKRASAKTSPAYMKPPSSGKDVALQNAAVRLPLARMRKARRVLPEENERLDGSDPEIGPSVPLTMAALTAQESALEVSQMLHEDGVGPAGPSESFDKTTQSQMLERYLRELASIEAGDRADVHVNDVAQVRQTIAATSKDPQGLRTSSELQFAVAIPNRQSDQPPKRDRREEEEEHLNEGARSKKQRNTTTHAQRTETGSARVPLGTIPGAAANRVRKPLAALQAGNMRKSAIVTADKQPRLPNPTNHNVPAAVSVKVPDFTFQVIGQQQRSFQERLAAWQAREAEAARSGKAMLQPLALRAKDPAKEARKADKPASGKQKRPIQAKEFSWHSDKRARERRNWEERLKEKEQILAELAEIKRLEAEAAEMENIRQMRAAQIPIAHPVPAFIRSKRHA